MKGSDAEILGVLDDLLKEDDVLVAMLARKGFQGTYDPTKFKLQDVRIWSALQSTMNEFFDIIEKFAGTGLDKVYFELGEYEAMFFIINQMDVALIVIIPALANKGLLEVEVENARRSITRMIGV
ncbi:MAG: hypothetical protein PHF51_03330 [Candidatus ainarchaeum sp.]|nr:hypothetical protein [Candidatus ainarchaeum sp.]